MRYRVTHRTAYRYDLAVSDSLGLAHLAPRPLPWQAVDGVRIDVTPAPADRQREVDVHGNVVDHFHVTSSHTELVIEAVSDVEVSSPIYDADGLRIPWEQARPMACPGLPDAWSATEFALESPGAEHAEGVAEYARGSFAPGRAIGDAVTELMHRINADFAYDRTATTVTSSVAEVMAERAGVCQDFAHLALACLRSQGLAARYVSGYLATEPPAGGPRVVGADASHAWVAVWIPANGPGGDAQWLAIDPTNDKWVDDRYITVAWGRDYGDVPPVKGVIFTEAKRSTLRVSVDVAPVAA